VEVKVRRVGTARPAYVDPQSPAVQVAARAYELGFGVLPIYGRGGGALPIVVDFHDSLGTPVVLIGLGLPDDKVHVPNEMFHPPNFRGVESLIRCHTELPGRWDLTQAGF
jgi:acetylornithine deacetylase/succinyl-diaminopimelate desuccinylase-like protein